MITKTTLYSDEDIFNLAYDYGNPSDAYFELGQKLLKKWENGKAAKLHRDHAYSDDYSDDYLDAVDDLIKEKTGVTLSKIQKYNNIIWADNMKKTKQEYKNIIFGNSRRSQRSRSKSRSNRRKYSVKRLSSKSKSKSRR